MSRSPSIASVIRTVQAAGFSVAEVIVEPGGFRVLTSKPPVLFIWRWRR